MRLDVVTAFLLLVVNCCLAYPLPQGIPRLFGDPPEPGSPRAESYLGRLEDRISILQNGLHLKGQGFQDYFRMVLPPKNEEVTLGEHRQLEPMTEQELRNSVEELIKRIKLLQQDFIADGVTDHPMALNALTKRPQIKDMLPVHPVDPNIFPGHQRILSAFNDRVSNLNALNKRPSLLTALTDRSSRREGPVGLNLLTKHQPPLDAFTYRPLNIQAFRDSLVQTNARNGPPLELNALMEDHPRPLDSLKEHLPELHAIADHLHL